MTHLDPLAASVVVVGAGQAGFSLCDRLRKQGHTGSITIVGAEPHLPYQRPPLSKAYMLGEFDRDRLMLRPEEYYAQNSIRVATGTRIASVSRDRQVVRAESGEEFPYDLLALATGARPRRLPDAIGGSLAQVHYLRTIEDSDRLSDLYADGARLLVAGGGYIGLEVAACARSRGAAVIVAEAARRILSRVAGEEIARRIGSIHQDRGVDLRCGAAIDSIVAVEEGAIQSQFRDGAIETADAALAGIGAAPRTELAEEAGLAVDNGIAVDERCRTSDPRIYAAGDCASFPFRGGRVRLESVQNAIDQAAAAADSMLGGESPYQPVPWFWSDQYDMHLQIAGYSAGHDRTVLRTTGEGRSCSVWYYRGGELLAVDAIDDSKAYIVAKRLLESGVSPDPEQVSDASLNVKQLLQSQANR